jgi:hypothetical protein
VNAIPQLLEQRPSVTERAYRSLAPAASAADQASFARREANQAPGAISGSLSGEIDPWHPWHPRP